MLTHRTYRHIDMHHGRCLLCEQITDLCQSHALPDALFRPLLRGNGGSAIHVTDDATTPVQLDSDSWKTPQLCGVCESLMNDEWDSYGIAFFQGRRGKPRLTDAGVTFANVDAGRIRMFALAVLWRMSVSVHPSYLNAHLPAETRDALRRTLLAKGGFRSSALQVTLERLHDTTPGGFSRSQFKDMVMAPFIRRHESYYAIGFAMFGFLVQVYVPSIPPRQRRSLHLVSTTGSIVFAPLLEFTAFPELFNLGVTALHKSITGLSKLKSTE